MRHNPGVRLWYRLDENNHRGYRVISAVGWDSNKIFHDIDLVPWLLGLVDPMLDMGRELEAYNRIT
jgi:hypothetical protein